MPIPFADPLGRSNGQYGSNTPLQAFPNPGAGVSPQQQAQSQLAQFAQTQGNNGRPISMGQPWNGRPAIGFPYTGPKYGVRVATPWGQVGSMLPQQQAQQASAYPFQLPQQIGLGDYYQNHATGQAQNVANSTVGANFLGNYLGNGYASPRGY